MSEDAVKNVRIEKRTLQGGSLFELILFPIGIAFCIGLFVHSFGEGALDYLALITAAVLTFAVLMEVPKTYHVVIEMDRDSISETKRGRTKVIAMDPTVKASVETNRRRADPSRTVVTGITVYNEKDYIDCDEIDGWRSSDIQALWDLLLVLVDEGRVMMGRSMEDYYYSLPDVHHVT